MGILYIVQCLYIQCLCLSCLIDVQASFGCATAAVLQLAATHFEKLLQLHWQRLLIGLSDISWPTELAM
jgi:hypothetical protein